MFTAGYETEYLTAKIRRRNKVNIFLHLVSGIVELKIDMKIGFREKVQFRRRRMICINMYN